MMIFKSLWYDRRINAAVLLGVMCAAAVLTGALLVGDSMRGSLRALTQDRLGRIDTILQGAAFFEVPTEFIEGELPQPWTEAIPVVLVSGAVEANGKISATQILGIDITSRGLCPRMPHPIRRNEITVNRTLAARLGIRQGDTISLRLNSPQSIPPESSLGRRNDLIVRARCTVHEIIPDEGLGRFSMKANQQAEPLILASPEWLQHRLETDGKVNAVLFMTKSPDDVSTPQQREELAKRFKPSAADLGITIDRKGEKTYVKSNRMMFTDPQAEAIREAYPEARPGLLYLATSIKAVKNGNETPYSTVFACDFDQKINENKEPDAQRNAASGLTSIILNEWTAADLDVEPGDEIELTWFDPENVNETHSKIFRLEKILPMDSADPLLVPEVKGFTDEAAIADWDPPFPFDAKKIRKKDEDYWDKYRAAPKAFVPLEIGQKLWASRFGNVTTFLLEKSLERQEKSPGRQSGGITALPPPLFGLTFLSVKEQGLAASAGTTPFSVLFLSFSFFIIASALMLVMMLFRLSVEMKARQIGIRLAVGWTRRQVARQLSAEGFFIAVLGSLLGVGFGVLYARIMVHGLTTWWVDAVTVPFLTLHITATSLVLGFLGGVLMSLATILWTLHSVRKASVKSLLGGDFTQQNIKQNNEPDAQRSAASGLPRRERKTTPILNILTASSFLTIFILIVGNFRSEIFFLVAGILLATGIAKIANRFSAETDAVRKWNSLSSLAASNVVRNRNRSLLCIGLVASTTFLVLSIGAFRLETENERAWHQTRQRGSGNGGFSYIAETTFPVYQDISTKSGRETLGIQPEDEKYLSSNISETEKWLSFRMNDGDNASCLNLYEPNRPRIFGVPRKIVSFSRFSFALRTPATAKEKSPWSPLWHPVTVDPDGVKRVPAVMDANTAMYALHLYGGVGDTYDWKNDSGATIRFEIVGLLSNSMLQGGIMIGEEHFVELFPDSGGYRLFLFGYFFGPHWHLKGRKLKILYDLLGDYGFQGEPTADRLRKLFAVQNTYLSTFQSLGGVGLLLGVFGLAVIQLRNVFERRKELALMQAVGFRQSRIILLLLYESFSLLSKGLGLAVVASLIALLPFLLGFAVQQASFGAAAVQFIWLVGGMLLVGLVSNVAAAMAVLRIPVARELAEER